MQQEANTDTPKRLKNDFLRCLYSFSLEESDDKVRHVESWWPAFSCLFDRQAEMTKRECFAGREGRDPYAVDETGKDAAIAALVETVDQYKSDIAEMRVSIAKAGAMYGKALEDKGVAERRCAELERKIASLNGALEKEREKSDMYRRQLGGLNAAHNRLKQQHKQAQAKSEN